MHIGARYTHWRYKNTFLLLVSLVVLFIMIDTPFVREMLHLTGRLGYFGAFIAGILFVSTFTVAPAGVVLYFLAGELNPYYVAIIAGVGAVIGDYAMFRFLKDSVFQEIAPFFLRFHDSRLSRLFATPHFAWLTPFLGAVLIASPLPDEIGIGLLGVTHLRRWQFISLSFVLNAIGIFLLISVTVVLR